MGFKPSEEEQKWAKQLEMDLKKELIKNLSEEERQELKELHWKKCPKDGIDLIQFEIKNTNITIDKCVICDGIWFDRIDLEKLLQSSEKAEDLLDFFSEILGIKISKFEE